MEIDDLGGVERVQEPKDDTRVVIDTRDPVFLIGNEEPSNILFHDAPVLFHALDEISTFSLGKVFVDNRLNLPDHFTLSQTSDGISAETDRFFGKTTVIYERNVFHDNRGEKEGVVYNQEPPVRKESIRVHQTYSPDPNPDRHFYVLVDDIPVLSNASFDDSTTK